MTNPRLIKQVFFSNSAWLCPPGVTFVIVTGCGGGGGGGGGASVSASYPSVSWQYYYATGGGGGEPAPTQTQIVPVVPGLIYTISIGLGGAGGPNGFVYNRVGPPTGGLQPGANGSPGGATLFGPTTFVGGLGGRGGTLLFNNPGAISGSSNTNTSPQIFWEPTLGHAVASGDAIDGSTHPTTTAPGADQYVLEGQFNSAVSLVTYPFLPGQSPLAPHSTGLVVGGGGGGGGGFSNNIYSIGGIGGCGAATSICGAFSGGGGAGVVGGGGGGGGGGENGYVTNYNNTHDGAFGGGGGNGFLEISWMG